MLSMPKLPSTGRCTLKAKKSFTSYQADLVSEPPRNQRKRTSRQTCQGSHQKRTPNLIQICRANATTGWAGAPKAPYSKSGSKIGKTDLKTADMLLPTEFSPKPLKPTPHFRQLKDDREVAWIVWPDYLNVELETHIQLASSANHSSSTPKTLGDLPLR